MTDREIYVMQQALDYLRSARAYKLAGLAIRAAATIITVLLWKLL